MLWGAGTALGEIPPYAVAYHASVASGKVSGMEEALAVRPTIHFCRWVFSDMCQDNHAGVAVTLHFRKYVHTQHLHPPCGKCPAHFAACCGSATLLHAVHACS